MPKVRARVGEPLPGARSASRASRTPAAILPQLFIDDKGAVKVCESQFRAASPCHLSIADLVLETCPEEADRCHAAELSPVHRREPPVLGQVVLECHSRAVGQIVTCLPEARERRMKALQLGEKRLPDHMKVSGPDWDVKSAVVWSRPSIRPLNARSGCPHPGAPCRAVSVLSSSSSTAVPGVEEATDLGDVSAVGGFTQGRYHRMVAGPGEQVASCDAAHRDTGKAAELPGQDAFVEQWPTRSPLATACPTQAWLLVSTIGSRIGRMAAAKLPEGAMERILEVLEPEEVWLFGSRARETHRPDSDWDLMAVLPDSASEDRLDLGKLWTRLRDLRRQRVDVFPIRRRDFDQDRQVFGELAEAVAREGRLIHGR